MNLESKTYQIRNSTEDYIVCIGVLQFPKNTPEQHWQRIAQKIAELISNPADLIKDEDWNYHEVVEAINLYVSQHQDSGFTIEWFWGDSADYIIRI